MGPIKDALKRKIEPQKQALEGKIKGKIYDALSPAESLINKVRPDENDGRLKREQFPVIGIYYHMGEVGDLANFNTEYDLSGAELVKAGKVMQKVFRYKYTNKPVELKQDDGLWVYIAGKCVGCISTDDAPHVLDLIQKKDVKFISAFVYGGPYKVVSENGDAVPMDDQPKARVTIGYV